MKDEDYNIKFHVEQKRKRKPDWERITNTPRTLSSALRLHKEMSEHVIRPNQRTGQPIKNKAEFEFRIVSHNDEPKET